MQVYEEFIVNRPHLKADDWHHAPQVVLKVDSIENLPNSRVIRGTKYNHPIARVIIQDSKDYRTDVTTLWYHIITKRTFIRRYNNVLNINDANFWRAAKIDNESFFKGALIKYIDDNIKHQLQLHENPQEEELIFF